MKDLEGIKKDLHGLSEDARFGAWLMLYQSEGKEAADFLESVIVGKDPVLKIFFSRFLGRINEEKSITFLRRLLQDENIFVFDAARKAFEKNRHGQKVVLLLPLVASSSKPACFFAIERLSLGGVEQVIDDLIPLLETDQEDLLIRLLSALRHFPNERVLKAVLPFTKDSREEIRFRALLVFGACYESGLSARSSILNALEDPSPRIRQSALWTMRKRPHSSDVPYLFKISLSDEDMTVRQESLLELTSFPSGEVIHHLIHVMVNEKERLVVLKAESVLMLMPPQKLVSGLERILQENDGRLKNKALVLFAEFQRDSREYYRHLVSGLEKADSEKDQLAFIEAFGVFEDKNAIPILEKMMLSSTLLAYTSMMSIMKIWRRHTGIDIIKYLENPKVSLLLKQMIMKEIIRKGSGLKFDERWRGLLQSFLTSENMNLQYLSAQALLLFDHEKSIAALFNILFKDFDKSALSFIEHGIAQVLAEKPQLSIGLVEESLDDTKRLKRIFDIFGGLKIPKSVVNQFVFELIGERFSLYHSKHKDQIMDWVASLFHTKKIDTSHFFDTLLHLPFYDEFLRDLLEKLSGDQLEPITLTVSVFEKWLAQKPEKQPKQFYRDVVALAGYTDNRALIPGLMKFSSMQKLKKDQEIARMSLRRIFQRKEHAVRKSA